MRQTGISIDSNFKDSLNEDLTDAPKTTNVCGILPSKWVPSQIIVEDLRDLIIRSSVSELCSTELSINDKLK